MEELTPSQFAEKLGVTTEAVYKWIKDKKIKVREHFKGFRKTYHIPYSELDKFKN